MSNIASRDSHLFVERVRCFIKWHESRFEALDKPHEPISNPVGWTRNDEHWISPDAWRNLIFDGDEDAAKEASYTLRDLGLLRVREPRWCQIVVNVRGTSCKVYAVLPAINNWRVASRGYADYQPAQLELPQGENSGSPALIPLSADGSPPEPDLAALLEAASRLGLEKAIAILTMQLDPESRHSQTLLRAQTALVSTALSAQVKVDEVRLQSNRRDEGLQPLLERLAAALKEKSYGLEGCEVR